MENKKPLIIFFCALFFIAFVSSFYVSGIALLTAAGLPVTFDSVHWNTFIDTYSQYSSNKAYRWYFVAGFVGMAIPFVIFILFCVVVFLALRKKITIHGAARLANDTDLRKSGFFPDDKAKKLSTALLIGKIYEGKYKGEYLKYIGQQFLMLYAPTRSGKGVGIVIPNCLYYQESLVILDIKLENFTFTAGHRKDNLFQEVYLFCPDGYSTSDDMKNGKMRSHRYNPLHYIRRDPIYCFGDLSKISSILFPLTGDKNDMWTDLSANVFMAIVLFLIDCENEYEMKEVEVKTETGFKVVEEKKLKYRVTLSQAYELSVPKDGQTLGDWFISEINQRNTDENKSLWDAYLFNESLGDNKDKSIERPALNLLSDQTVSLMRQYSQQKPEQQQSILLTFNANMKMFGNPVTAAATDGNDFDLRDVRRKKMTIYFGLAPAALSQYARLTNLFFSQLLNENVRTLPEQDPTLKYQCVMMLDEFTSMGCVDVVQVALAFTAGYNMRFVFILQNQEQLFDDKKGYGKNGGNTILENCAVQLVYPPKKVNETVKQVSETIGYYDLKLKKKSKTSGKNSSTSESPETHKRAVLLPQEITELREIKHKSGLSLREIVLSESCKPIVCNKIVYFEEPYFLDRKGYSEKNVPVIPVLDIEQNEVSRLLFEMNQRDIAFVSTQKSEEMENDA